MENLNNFSMLLIFNQLRSFRVELMINTHPH
jgi:hypothetical protein